MIRPRIKPLALVWIILGGAFGAVWFSASLPALQSVLAAGDVTGAWRVIRNAFSMPGGLLGLAIGAATGFVLYQLLRSMRSASSGSEAP